MKFSQLLNRKDSIKEKAQTAFVRASNLFDERWYASRYQDVFKKLKDPARHYYLVGWKENRNPSENFDTASYLRQYPECGICPIVFEHNRNDYADLAVCIIVKDEASYIKEWLDYHLMVGVKRFYIYDNESFDNLKQVLLPYIRQGVVIYQYYPGEAMQLNCYRDCLKQYGDKNEWIAFIDADEFIIPMENATIPEFLADYKEYPAVGVNWVSYDSNGHKEKPKGGVMENYTRVHYDENLVPFHLIKSIVRPQEVSKVVNPHFFLYKGDKLAVNENKEEIGGDLSERAYISPFSTNKIRINHYYCKSRSEAEAKVLRGSSDRDIRRRKSISAKELNFPDYKYDYTAYKFVLQLNPEKAKIEEIKMAWLRLKNAFIEFKHTFNPSPLYDYIDEEWYFKQYPDAKKSGMSAAKHYVNIGWRKGYNPSKKFNTEFYLNKYKDVAKAHICPLLHYLNSGKNEGRLAYETDTVISTTEPVSQPLLKHLSEWVKNLSKEKEREYNELWQNKAYFDENWYLKQYPDAKESGMSAKKHYDTIGWLQGYNPSAKFKTNEYLKQYPECKICPIDFEYNRNRYVDLAVCAIMKNEAPYVKEWLDYHQMVGVKRFYIYDNESGDDLCQVLLPYIRQGIVVYKNYPGEAKQMPAYNEFIKEYGDKNEWVAFIDADEFIIPMEKESIPEFLADYKEYPGIGINWVAYDSNGHKAKPEGGVLENYTRVHYDENLVPFHQIKSIVQPSQVDKIINPHYALFKDNKLAVNENKQEIGGSLEERAYISPFSANKIRINHYFCKSEEEYKAKIERGRAPTKRGVKRVYNQNQVFFDDYKYDYSAYRFVTKLKPEIAQDEEVKYVWQKMKNAWIAFKHSFNQNPLYDYIDEKWYFEQYPDAKESGMSAAEHYMNIGWRKGYNPSEKFDTNFYLKKYKDVARMHVCPLLHYLNSGKKENRLAFEGDTVSHTEQSDIVIPTTKPVSQKIEGHTGFSPVSQPTQNNTVIPAQNNTVIPATEPVSLPLLKSLCEWCKTLFKGKEEPRLTVNTKYVANPFRYITDHIFLSDKELKAPKYENAVLLPIRSRNDGSIWYMGGVLDADGNYIEETSLKGEIKYNDYKIEKDLHYIDEDVVYIGLYWNHYGHFVIEQVARLWYYIQNRDKNLKLCYSMANNEPLPQYIEQFFKLLGITDKNSLRVSEPTKFKSITIPEMSVSASSWYTKEYQLIYDTVRENIVPVYNDKVYFSRTHFKKCREYEFGEWYIEKLFASNGYKIIHPEELSFIGQLSIIKGAKTIACISGSLLHQMLFAKEGTELIILQQFEEINSAQRPVNEMRKLKVTYIDCYAGLPHIIQGVGPYLLVNNNALQNFANDNNFIGVEYDREKARDDFYKYIDKWQEYADSKRLKTVVSEDEKEKSVAEFKQKHIRNGIVDCDIKSIVEKYFDEKWYEENYPEYKKSKLMAFEHYIFYGWKLGYNPSKQFDGNAYLARYTDVAKIDMNPLIHYVLHGEREGRQIFSVKQREEVKKSQSNILYWIKSIFAKKKINENPLWRNKEYFDEDWYVANYAEVASYKNGPKAHYRAEGWKQGYNPSANFKTNEYLKQYPECKICPIDFEYNRNGYVDLSVCAIMKNEGPYVKEWIDFHRLVGVKRFYIYDNESTDNMKKVLTPYIEQGVVVYKYYPGEKMQMPAYNECVSDYKDKTKWLAVIDADEFIVPTEKNSIPEFLEDFEQYPGVGINWICFDSDGNKIKPQGGVLTNYTRVHYDDQFSTNRHIKSIVRPNMVDKFLHPHFAFYKSGKFAVTENYEELKELDYLDKTRKLRQFYTDIVSVNKIRINHYYCKSEEEYIAKVNRGMADHKKEEKRVVLKEDYIYKLAKNDYTVYRYVKILNNKLGLSEALKYYRLKYLNMLMFFKTKGKGLLSYYFDEKWYIKNYPDVLQFELSPLRHYLTVGWKKGYNPSDRFDTSFYLREYKDVAQNGINPLVHYINSGILERRLPKEGLIPELNVLDHYENLAIQKKKLAEKYKIVEKSPVDRTLYNLLKKSDLFDKKYYLLHHPLLMLLHRDPIEHYLTVGWKKGYNPSKRFDGNAYLDIYKDVKNAGKNPLLHYLENGKVEGRSLPKSQSWINKLICRNSSDSTSLNNPYELLKKSKLFNSKWYLKQYPEVAKLGQDPAYHYLNIGWKKGYNPSYLFNNNAYLDLYQDVKKNNVCPLLHYIRTGKNENRHIYSVNQEVFTADLPNMYDEFVCKNKTKNPLISIIVASYNYADLITRTLDSLIAQTYRNFEVIVVDDGSKDNSVKVIKKYTAKYPYIKLYRHQQGKNMGLPATIKLGLEKSKGEYIAFCESDDYWDKNHLEEKVKIINEYANPKVIVNDVELFGDKERCEHISIIVNDRKSRFCHTKNRISVSDFRDKNWIVTFSCCMIKRTVLEKCDITGTPRGANLDWWIYRQVCCTNKVFYVNKKLTYWYIHNSYMVKEDVDSVQKQEKFLKLMDVVLLKKHPIKAFNLIKYHSIITNSYQVKDGKIYHYGNICKYQPKFSVVMPTYDRKNLINIAIDSLLKQTYQNFELIIVDDGSTDGTVDVINSKYSKELNSGKIKYIYKENGGVCRARNTGLQNTSNEWIAYLDSDNILSSNCLEVFAKAILQHKRSMLFYSDLVFINNKMLISHEFNYEQLLKENYIDLGVFVHHRTIYEELGGFDENMTRLVDWDLVARYTKDNKPVHIKTVTLYYNDSNDYDRITGSAKLYDNIAYFRKKNCNFPVVTTMITTYNHQDYIREAVDSAIKQIGNFIHEIIISDDGSTDSTPEIIAEYAKQYPHLIRNISSGKNVGISANMKKCFEAATGKYIAILEGDDYWTDAQKLEKQMQFLEKNKDCSMVFSRIKLLNESNNTMTLLERHEGLPNKLNGDHFIKELSLIVNFSCTMYRAEYLKKLPEVLYRYRLSEIALAFYLEQKGKIGFIVTPLSVYRQNSGGTWSGSNKRGQIESGIQCIANSKAICREKYKSFFDDYIMKKTKELSELRDYEYYKNLPTSEYKNALKEWYKKITGKDLNLDNPQTFNEKIQWLKLYDSTPIKTQLADKYLVREWVKEKIGDEYLIPLLGVYDSFDEIDFGKLPKQFVIKCNHGSGWNIIVKDKKELNLRQTKLTLDSWMHLNYAFMSGMELHYRNMQPKIIIEQYMDDGTGDLRDYKYTCFDGKPEFIWIDSDRHTEHKRNLYNLNWEQMQCKVNSHYDTFPSPERPKCLEKMNQLASVLSEGFQYVRVDFYIINERIYFGEMTFTSSSGTEEIQPKEFEDRLSAKITIPNMAYDLDKREFYPISNEQTQQAV